MAEREYGLQMYADTPPNAILGGYDSYEDAAYGALGGDVVLVREVGEDGQSGEWQEARRG